ncbi:MAG: SDR family oxidoreductase [Candidatus Sumerlaeota bacterium]|nr:SDR family oxidoreductase [Candidatus Sumerlaeota bacterium]
MSDLRAFDLTGKTALVTGSNTGLGLGMARGLARAGARIAVHGRDAQKNRRALDELLALNPGCREFRFDLEETQGIGDFYEEVSRMMGGIDILINNAALQHRGRADTIELEAWERIHRINVTAPFVLAQCFARERIAAGKPGSIIFVASLMSEAARPTTSPYASTKGAIRQLIRALAVDWAPFGIRVNGIGPGYNQTEMTRPLYEDPEFDTWVRKRTPLGRWGLPEDYEGAAVFLASQAAAFITGQILYVDGGWLATF